MDRAVCEQSSASGKPVLPHGGNPADRCIAAAVRVGRVPTFVLARADRDVHHGMDVPICWARV